MEYNIINFDVERYSKDKKTIADTIGYNIVTKLQSMFKWEGLPDTIPQKWLEVMLVSKGHAFVTEVDGELYAFTGGLGGEPDPYYQPTICVVANPALKFSKECKIGEDGILISNDTLRHGIIPLVGKYAGLLAENTITTRIAIIMSRITNIISGSDESTIASALEYLKQIERGQLGIIEESPFLEDLKVQVGALQSVTRLTDLIEMEQYLKASLYNELGLQANYNMKREAINGAEAALGDDILQPFIDNMLKCRQEACELINAKYGTNISVDFASAWEENEDQRDIELQELENEMEETAAEVEKTESETEQVDVETEVTEETQDEVGEDPVEETPEEESEEQAEEEEEPQEESEDSEETEEESEDDNVSRETSDEDDESESEDEDDEEEDEDEDK